ncbi:hypothetical protein F4810DRAFT_716194 [Camillea tinctor]|nr:hypothetical protein F4810DRAFT_716194 [Camillea tinctor]
MAPTSWICLYFSFYFSFFVLTTAFVVPRDGREFLPAYPIREQSLFESTPGSVADECPRRNEKVENGTLIDQLWKANCDLVNKFLNNCFSVLQATKGDDEALDSFKYYSVQDYYYLVQTAQHKANLLPTFPTPDAELAKEISATVQSMNKSLDDAREFREILTKNLTIPDSAIDNGALEAAGLGYVKWLQENTNLGWFAFEVSRIPCVYGWAELASNIESLPGVNNSTTFYQLWVKPNLDWGYGVKMSKKFEEHPEFNNSETFPVYNDLFRQALRFETAFFESAINKSLNSIT